MLDSSPQTVAVIGTSNSLLKVSWVNQIRLAAESNNWKIINRSIGGSSSLLGAYSVACDPRVKSADRIIVDFFINDQLFIQEEQATLDHVVGHYTSIFQTLSEHSCLDRLLILMLPQQNVDAELFDKMISYFQLIGVRYIDLRTNLNAWQQEDMVESGEQYSDPFHFTEVTQKKIAKTVTSTLHAMSDEEGAHSDSSAELLNYPKLGLTDLEFIDNNAPRISVGTSAITCQVKQILDGNHFSLQGATYLVGAKFWVTENAGALTIRGKSSNFRLHPRRSYKGLLICDTIFKPVQLQEVTRVDAANDLTAPFQRMRGQNSSIYETEDCVSLVETFIGAEYSPEELGQRIRKSLEMGLFKPLVVAPDLQAQKRRRSIFQYVKRAFSRLRGN